MKTKPRLNGGNKNMSPYTNEPFGKLFNRRY